MTTAAVCTCVRITHSHGQYQMYHRHGCRCLKCGVAASEAKRRYKAGGSYVTSGEGLVDRTGTVRRLRALLRLGWRHCDLSPRLTAILGRPASSELILKHPGETCFAATETAVRSVYTELSMRPGPSQRNRNRTEKLGYLPPLCWDDDTIDDPQAVPYTPTYQALIGCDVDEIAVERRIAGDFIHLTRHEIRAAVQLLHGRGWNATTISTRLRVSGSTVNQHIDAKDTAA